MLGGAALDRQALQHADRLISVDAALDQHLKRLAGELIDDVEQLQDASVGRLVKLKIERPHLIRALRPQPLRRDRRLPQPPALALALRDPQPFLAPDPLHPLAVDLPAQLPQAVMRAPVPPPRPLHREAPQLRPQRRVILSTHQLATLRRAMLPDHPACPALADAETVAHHRDPPAPADRAYQFPREISSSARTCSAWSATISFNRPFSRSSSFRRLASWAFIPPYWLRQR